MLQESPFIKVEHLGKQVPNGANYLTILHDVNLTIKQGESVAILGASGSGKTTLLNLLAGLDIPTSGDISLHKYHLNKLDEEQRAHIRGKYIGIVFQSFELLPTLTALENVMLPLEIQYVSQKRCKQEAKEWLAKVGLEARLHHYPAKLSGGEQQRVAIARAFVTNPNIILADEMTGNLDSDTGIKIADIMFSLQEQESKTLVLVTHDANLAARCQKKLLLHKGVLQSC